MSDDRLTDPDKRLEQVIDALRDQTVPEGPSAEVREHLLGALAAAETSVPATAPPSLQRRTRTRRVLVLAASLLFVSVVLGWLFLAGDSSHNSAFAQMLKEVAGIRTAEITSQAEINQKQRINSKVYLRDPDRMRQEVGKGDNHFIIIVDFRHRQMLGLQPAKKTASRSSFEVQAGKKPTSIIQSFREMREDSAEFLGHEAIDGRDALKYCGKHPIGYYLLWFGAEDHLPVKLIVSDTRDPAKAEYTETWTDFRWNVPLDDRLFSLEIPDGYTLMDQRVKVYPMSFIAVLRALVKLGDERFPDALRGTTLESIVDGVDDHAELVKVLNDSQAPFPVTNLDQTLAQANAFVDDLGRIHFEWHYLGKGVKLGEADKVVAWWAPKEQKGDEAKAEATVLFGDLHTETRPVAGLPTAAQ